MTGPEAPKSEQRLTERAANRLLSYGAPGAFLAVLLLKAQAASPFLLFNLKSGKILPVAVLCCAEVSWLFGGTVGLMLAFQWLVHELAHMRAAQNLGMAVGWRSFVPFIGVYSGTRPTDFRTREDEALVALSGVSVGLVLATVLFGYGQMVQSPAMLLAAKLGYALNLINLLPFRPFDGGRIFPGYLWRYVTDRQDDPQGDAPSRRFVAACRVLSEKCFPAPQGRPKGHGTVLADATIVLMMGGVFVVSLIGLLLPPLVFSLALLGVFVALWAFIAALIALDPRAVMAPVASGLQPRRPARATAVEQAELPWQDRQSAMAALAIYLMAVAACSVGMWAA